MASSCVLIFAVIGHNTINIPEIFQVFTVFRSHYKSRGKGTRREVLPGRDKIELYRPWTGVLTKVPGGEAHIPYGTKGNQEGWPSWLKYRSRGTGGPT